MSCSDFVRRLQVVLDQRQDPQQDPTLTQHAQHCDDCRERLDAQERLFMVLAAYSSDWCAPPDDGEQTVPANATPAVRANVWRFVAMAMATSAVLMAILFAAMNHRRNRTLPLTLGKQPAQPVALAPRVTKRSLVPAASASVRDADVVRNNERGSPEATIARPTARPPAVENSMASFSPTSGRVMGQLALTSQAERLSNFYETMCKAPPLPDNSIPQVDHLANEFRPLAQPFVSVLNALRSSLPRPRTPAEPPRNDETSYVPRDVDLA